MEAESLFGLGSKVVGSEPSWGKCSQCTVVEAVTVLVVLSQLTKEGAEMGARCHLSSHLVLERGGGREKEGGNLASQGDNTNDIPAVDTQCNRGQHWAMIFLIHILGDPQIRRSARSPVELPVR